MNRTLWQRFDQPVRILVVTVFLVSNLVNGVRKVSDFDVYVEAGSRLLADSAPYAGSTIASGFVGPPAQVLLFVPFAPIASLDLRAARLVWYVVNVLLLWYALTTWIRILTSSGDEPSGWRGTLMRAPADVLLALAGVLHPLQNQFEHQNLNVVLLALGACAADALRRGRPTITGLALGAAAAIKVYPALALVWLIKRRAWRALGVAIAAGALLSVAPALLRGIPDFLRDVEQWQSIMGEGWPARRANQSVVAMWGRYLLGEAPEGYPIVTWNHANVMVCSAVLSVALLVLVTTASGRRASGGGIAEELACVSAAAALISPIAWEHYWLAWFPVLLALRLHARDGGPRWAAWAFWIGALLITGLSRPTVGWDGARLVRELSLKTWGGLITCACLALLLLRHRRTHDDARGALPS